MKNSDVQREIGRMTESRKMNKRIVELALQAGSTHKQNLGVYQFYTDELEKFAELIIKEVFAEIENQGFEIYQPVIDAVKTHFGVKE